MDFEAAGRETMHQRDSKSFRKLKTIIFTGWLFAALPLFSSAETLLTEPEVLKIVFPKSQSVETQVRTLAASQRDALQKKAGLRFPETEYRMFIGHGKEGIDGYAVIMNEIGKHEYITFIVGVSPKGEIRDVAVMDYRETRGWEVKEQRFLRQFRGKSLADPITVDRDIVNYTRRDAVLACHSTRSEESAFAGPSILFATCRQQTAMKLSSKSRFLFHPRFAGKKLLFCLLFTAALSSGSDTPARRRHTQIRYIMGTLCEITAYPTDQDKDNTDIAINAAFDELKRIDSVLSNWNPNSELMRMNSAASRPDVGGIRPAVTLSPELFERIKIALDVARDSQGLFDPTVGPLVRAWGFLPSPTKPQNRARVVAAARSKVGWEKVKLDTVEHTVQFAAPDMEIDLGGIVKGYAAGKAAQVLRVHSIQSGLVSLGASSITAIGNAPGATGWRVFIRDPRDGQSPAPWIDLHDGESLATSGTYEKTVSVGKSRHSHIIDPRTDEAIGGAVSVTVLLDDAEIADALTKPFFMSPPRSAEYWAKWLARFPKASIILMTAPGGNLEWIRAGAHAERFLILPLETGRTHVAKTN